MRLTRLTCLTLACLIAAIVGIVQAPSTLATQTTPRAVRRAPQDVAVFVRQYNERQARFLKGLDELARDCDRKDLTEAAKTVRELKDPPAKGEVRLQKLPRNVQAEIPAGLPAEERFWKSQLRHLRQVYARDMFLLSRRTLTAGYTSLAYELVREVVQHDTDHPNARRILGYVRQGNEWMSPFEARMRRSRMTFHPQFGWIPQANVARYEAGERPYLGKWISAAKERELRHDFRNAWRVKTEHYEIYTNHSLERGVELATKLEGFHELFFQVLAGFFNTSEQAKQLFEGANGKGAVREPDPNVIYYFRTRDEYITELRKKTKQNVAITRGIFFPDDGIAYFYDDPETDDFSTLFHEGTHQLLAGSRPQGGPIGVRSDFWLIEGIACYMESFQRQGDRFSVGSTRAPRLVSARYNLVNQNYYVPLREFAALGMEAFQNDPNIRKNYSQCAALTHFFLHAQDGKYREALIEHLSQIYSPRKVVRASPEPLCNLIDTSDEILDEEYKQFMKNLDKAPNPEPAPPEDEK